MTGLAIITARSAADLPRARVEAALQAGRAVNVSTVRRGAKALVVRVLPIREGFLALAPAVDMTGLRQDAGSALHRPMIQAERTFEGGVPEMERRG